MQRSEEHGLPLAVGVAGASRTDMQLLAPTLDAVLDAVLDALAASESARRRGLSREPPVHLL